MLNIIVALFSGFLGAVVGAILVALVSLYPNETRELLRYIFKIKPLVKKLWSWEVRICITEKYFAIEKQQSLDRYIELLNKESKLERLKRQLGIENSCLEYQGKETINYTTALKEEKKLAGKLTYEDYKKGQ